MTRNLLPALKTQLDGFTVTGTGSNGLANGTTHTYNWSDYGDHLSTPGKQVWGFKVSDPHRPASIGAGSEEGRARYQVEARWPLDGGDGNLLNQTDYEQLVEDEIHSQIRSVETSIGNQADVIAHVSEAQSVLEQSDDGTVVRGVRVEVFVDRIETYA